MAIAALTAALKRIRGGPYSLLPAGQPPSVTFPSSPLSTRVYIALGADLTASHLTWNWLDITDRVRHDLGISVAAGRRDESTQVTPSRCQLKIENDDGAFCRRNPFSPYYGLLTKNTPIWIQLDPGSGFVDRYFGFINEWPTRWTDESATDTTVTIQCAGVMRRLAQGQVLRSPMFRSMIGVAANDYTPHAYWPMEDGRDATQFASAMPGGRPLTISGEVSFAAASDLIGSEALPTLDAAATVTAVIPSYTNEGQWVYEVAFKLPSEPGGTTDIAELSVLGGFWSRHVVRCMPGTPSFLRLDSYVGATLSDSLSVELDATAEANVYGHWVMLSISETTVGSFVDAFADFHYFAGGELVSSGGGSVQTGAPGVLSTATLWGGNGISFGHQAIYTDARFNYLDEASNNAQAMNGHAGELAHERMRRLCREEGVQFTTQAATSAAMGPQPTGTLLGLLRDCEVADQGVLHEYQYGLAYQALSERYNQPVAFNLDFDSGHIAGTPEPADDDQRLVNKFTASRPDGSSATAEEEAGTLGTGPGGSGVYDSSATVNVEADSQLADFASWRVHLGTVDEDRWPVIPFRLHGSPDLIPGWLSTPFGARINVANPPSQMNPDTIDAVIEGYAERWDTVSWGVALTTSPASPYRIFTLEDASLGLIDSGSSTLAAAVSAGAGSLSVATSNIADLWSTDSADYPLTVQVSGIDIEVTAVSGASSPQTFTVTGATVTKDISAGWSVELADPTYLGV
jgi:hypothetical protein